MSSNYGNSWYITTGVVDVGRCFHTYEVIRCIVAPTTLNVRCNFLCETNADAMNNRVQVNEGGIAPVRGHWIDSLQQDLRQWCTCLKPIPVRSTP